MSGFVPIDRSVLYSPAWFVPFDEFAQVRSAGVRACLDRWDEDEGAWVALDTPAVRTPSAAIAYPGLGRRGGPGRQRYRVRFAAAGYQPLYPADGQPFSADVVGVEFVAYPYDDIQPPARPRVVRLLPGVSFRYPPRLRTVYGVVLDGTTRVPVANALVRARGRTSRDAVEWQERTLTGTGGAFRLALRWEGERVAGDPAEETFRLLATERPGRTGSLVVRLPAELDRRHVIEIVEQ